MMTAPKIHRPLVINLNTLRPTTRPTPEQIRQRILHGLVAEMTLSQAGLDPEQPHIAIPTNNPN